MRLRWKDLDFENRTIHIENTLTDVAGKHWLQPPKTARSNRYIGMSDTLIELFREHRKHYEEKLEYLGELFEYPEMVFTTESGNYVDRSFLILNSESLSREQALNLQRCTLSGTAMPHF